MTDPGTSPGADWDVIVVGAGPAGSAAARAAAREGARVLVVERAAFPRYKRCGGGLVGRSQELAGVDLGPASAASAVDRMTFAHDGAVRGTRRAPRGFLRMVNRAEFDAALLASAVRAGAEVRTATVTRVAQDADAVTVVTRAGDELRARAVIGADGAGSRVAAAVGVRIAQLDFGFEGEFGRDPAYDGRALLDFRSAVPGCYGWVFPKGDRLTVGVIGPQAQAAELRATYRAMVAGLGLSGPAEHEGGHHTRVRAVGSPLVAGRVAVAGDAAGWLEPWSREGISFALRSGELAGRCAGRGRLGDYPRMANAALGPDVTAGARLLARLGSRPGLVAGTLAWAPGGFARFVNVVDGSLSLEWVLSARHVARSD